MLTVPTAVPSTPTVPRVMSPFEPEANVIFLFCPVMLPVSMVEEDVMDRCPPIAILPKSTDPALMVRAPVEVSAALPVILPRYQVPVVLTAADEDSARMPTLVPLAPMLPRVIAPVPDVKVTLEVPRSVPRVMASSDVEIEKAPDGVIAPRVAALVYQAPAVEIMPEL